MFTLDHLAGKNHEKLPEIHTEIATQSFLSPYKVLCRITLLPKESIRKTAELCSKERKLVAQKVRFSVNINAYAICAGVVYSEIPAVDLRFAQSFIKIN